VVCTLLASGGPLDHVVQHSLFTLHVAGREIAFTNHMLMMVVATVLLLVLLPLAARRGGLVPKGLSNFIESICVYIREEVARPALKDHTDRYIGYLWTTFFFILACNLLGMIPVGPAAYWLTGRQERMIELGGTPTANIWVTGMLAALAFVMIHVAGVRHQGVWKYIVNFIPHVPWPLIPVMYVLEIIGAMVKPFALAIRLFANMVAGHAVLAALMGVALASGNYAVAGVTVLGCTALGLLELFVAFLQAYIFTFLTTMFISAAAHPEH
jgi:F-type H+-transporting ATPase subunit a